MAFGRFLLERVLGLAGLLWVVSVLAFGLYALTPGDPARLLIEASGTQPAPEEQVRAKRAEMGLDDPLPARYLAWLGGAVRGDLGRSFRSYKPVTEVIGERVPATALLALTALTISAGVGIPLGLLAACRRGTLADGAASLVAVLGAAVPGFWMALLCMLIFSATLGWLPTFGSPTPQGIILPAFVLSLPYVAMLTRLTRATVLDILGLDFVTVARSKGLSRGVVVWRHVVPNALIPLLTVLGLELAQLLTGAVVVEHVFAWPGVGKIAIDAVLLGDIPVVVGFAVLAGLVFALVNLLVDLTLGIVDPRIVRA